MNRHQSSSSLTQKGGSVKKIGDHMKEMGFNEQASNDVKKAFIKYLMRESSFHDRVTDFYKYKDEEKKIESPVSVGEQLSFFDLTGTE